MRETLSFSRAADALSMSPSSLSQTVRAFEQRVDVQLLHRTTRNVSLTDVGEIQLKHIAPLVDELGVTLDQVHRYGDPPTGAVRIHASRLTAEFYLEPVLGSFCEPCLDVPRDITVEDRIVDLVAGG